MKLITIVDEDFINYKEPSMFIITCKCSFKCDKEYGTKICQNGELAHCPSMDVSNESIVTRYKNNPLTKSIVFGGLEPFDQYDELVELISAFRKVTKDTIVIYTGYKEEELDLKPIQKFSNIIIKFGRFIPNQEPHYDKVLGVELASPNQYAKRIKRGN